MIDDKYCGTFHTNADPPRHTAAQMTSKCFSRAQEMINGLATLTETEHFGKENANTSNQRRTIIIMTQINANDFDEKYSFQF